jgi:phage terminase small subunit
MGKRGPRPIPTSLKLYRGTARGRDKRRIEPRPGISLPRCPKDLPDEAQRIFRRLAKVLVPLGLLTIADFETFELLCLHGGLARRAAIEMAEAGLTTEDERGLQRKSPLNQMLKDHSEAYRRYAALDESRFFGNGRSKLAKYTNGWSDLAN